EPATETARPEPPVPPAPKAPAPPAPKPPPPKPAKPATPLPPKFSAPVEGLSMDDEVTAVTSVPPQLLEALGAEAKSDENDEWHRVFEDYLRIKKECGESIEGVTFEKFQATLRKTRDNLLEKHACKRV